MDRKGRGDLKPLPFTTGNDGEVDINDYDKIRIVHRIVNDGRSLPIGSRTLATEMSCPICLDLLTQTMTAKECLHRFCSECITMALQRGNKECPTCRKKLVSKRSLRADPNFDLLISKIFPDRSIYDHMQLHEVDSLTSQTSTNALMNSIEEGMKVQEVNRRKRVQGSYEFDKHRRRRENDADDCLNDSRDHSPPLTNHERTTAELMGMENVFECNPPSHIAPNYDYLIDDDDTYMEDIEDINEETNEDGVKQDPSETHDDCCDEFDSIEEELQAELEELDALEFGEIDCDDMGQGPICQNGQSETKGDEVDGSLDDSDSSSSTYSSSGCSSSTSEETSSLSVVLSEGDLDTEQSHPSASSLTALAQGLAGIHELSAPPSLSTQPCNMDDFVVQPPKHCIHPKDRLSHWLANSPSSPQTPEEDMNVLPERRSDDGEILDPPIGGSEELEAELLPALSLLARNCPDELRIPRYVRTKHDTTMEHLSEFLHQRAMEEAQSNQYDFDADPVPTIPKPQHFYVFSRTGGHHIRKIFLHESMAMAASAMTKGDHLVMFFDTAGIELRGQKQSVLSDVVPAHFLSLPTV